MDSLVNFKNVVGQYLLFSASYGLIGMGFCCFLTSTFILWNWRSTKPKDGKFYLLFGISLLSLCAVLGRGFFFAFSQHLLSKETYDFLYALVIMLAYGAYVLLFRAMTLHWSPKIWKIATAFFMVVSTIVFFLKVI